MRGTDSQVFGVCGALGPLGMTLRGLTLLMDPDRPTLCGRVWRRVLDTKVPETEGERGRMASPEQ